MLMYRFPGEEIISRKGSFKLLESNEELEEGFIIKPFKTVGIYRFIENDNSEFHFYEGQLPHETAKEEYVLSASVALDQLIQGDLQKVVLSRVKVIPFKLSSVLVAFEQLEATYPNAFVYLISSSEFGTWIGATPEVFLRRTGRQLTMASLAGTKKVVGDDDWTEKEFHEQRLVTDYIVASLEQIGAANIQVMGPVDMKAGPVKHLFTKVSGETDVSTMKLLNKLHPTPAVAGVPKTKVIEFIAQNERHDRQLYSGVIGYFSEKNSNLFVNLRCAQLGRNNAYLYVGGGLTSTSNVEEEWEETENKAGTLEKIFHFT